MLLFKEITGVFPGQKMWSAYGNKRQYIILKDGPDFTASSKSPHNGRTHHLIEYEKPVKTFDEAKAVCELDDQPTRSN
jgi:hypothetical protein